MENFNDIKDVYKSTEDYNPRKERKVLIVFDMITDMISNKKLNPVVTKLFVKGRSIWRVGILSIWSLLNSQTSLYQNIPQQGSIRNTFFIKKIQKEKRLYCKTNLLQKIFIVGY